MEINNGGDKSTVGIQKKGLFAALKRLFSRFRAPEFTPIHTKGESCTIQLAMSKKEIQRVAKQIWKMALKNAL